jgi:hypothetical protein
LPSSDSVRIWVSPPSVYLRDRPGRLNWKILAPFVSWKETEHSVTEVAVPLRPSGYAAQVLLAVLAIVRQFTRLLTRQYEDLMIADDAPVRTICPRR